MPDRLSAEQIFDKACDLPPAERAAYLDQSCGDDTSLRDRVEALLKADADAGSFLVGCDDADDPNATISRSGPIPGAATRVGSEQRGQMIDRFKLLEKIGEGGFGTVWMAEQREPVKRRVALKIIKLGMDTKQVIARFEAERQALAMMDHPNISRVLDAGATDTGRPYFAMEYVRGVGILDYCDTEKLDTEARLDLFMQVCRAIQHAHQKGIIHRDIKPGNVLITLHDGKPVPKVIDFGIAKATSSELTQKTLFTEHRQMIGTPAYMSPEQAEMSGLDVDTRSDIYSLGVLLYELLTGTTPFDGHSLMEAGFAEMLRIIREEEPHKPSTRVSTLGQTASRTAEQRRAEVGKLRSLLRGDLDWIVMKCLEKDRTRRYETANGLALDIERHLKDEPVNAGPPSASYKIQKFIRRNSAAVVAASIVIVTLVGGVTAATWGMLRARAAERVAHAESEAAEAARQEAEDQKQQAVAARDAAEAARIKIEQQAYTSALAAASTAAGQNDTIEARRHLEQAPEHLRGWEWQWLWNDHDRSLSTVTVDSDEVGSIVTAVSPDATLAAFSSTDTGPVITVADTTSGAVLHRFDSGGGDSIHGLEFSPDNRFLVVRYHALRRTNFIDLHSSAQLLSAKQAEDCASFITFTHDSRAAVVQVDEEVQIRTLPGWELLREFPAYWEGRDGALSWAGDISPDGRLLVVGPAADKGPMRIFDLHSGALVREIEEKRNASRVVFSTDGQHLWTLSGDDHRAYLYRTDTWERTRTIGRSNVLSKAIVAFAIDGREFVGHTNGLGQVIIRTAAEKYEMRGLRGPGRDAGAMAFDATRNELVVTHSGGRITRWDALGMTSIASPMGVEGARWQPHTGAVAIGHDSANYKDDDTHELSLVSLVDATSKTPCGPLQAAPFTTKHYLYTRDLAFDSTGRRLATALSSSFDSGMYRIWDLRTGLAMSPPMEHLFGPNKRPSIDYRRVAWSSDDRFVAFARRGRSIDIVDGDSGRHVRKIDEPDVFDVVFTPDGGRLVSVGDDGTMTLWSVDDGSLIARVGDSGDEALRRVAISADGLTAIAGAADGSLKWYTLDPPALLQRSDGHTGAVREIIFVPGADRVLTASADSTIRVWNTVSREQLVSRRYRTFRSLDLSEDGTRLLATYNVVDSTAALVFDTAPEAQRHAERRGRRDIVEDAEALVDRLMVRYGDAQRALEYLETDGDMEARLRAAAQARLTPQAWQASGHVADAGQFRREVIEPRLRRYLLQHPVLLDPDNNQRPDLEPLAAAIRSDNSLPPYQCQLGAEIALGYRWSHYLPPDRQPQALNEIAWLLALDPKEDETGQQLAYFAMHSRIDAHAGDYKWLQTYGMTQYRMGLYASSLASFDRALELLPESERLGSGVIRALRAMCLRRLSRSADATRALHEAEAIVVEAEAAGRKVPEARSALEQARATLAGAPGELPDETAVLAKLDARREALRFGVPDSLDTAQRRAERCRKLGQLDEERAALKLALQFARERSSDSDFKVLKLQGYLASNLFRTGQDEAGARAFAAFSKALQEPLEEGAFRKSELWALHNVGYQFQANGRLDEALSVYNQILGPQERLSGGADHDTRWTRRQLQNIYRQQQRWGEAETVIRDWIRTHQEGLGDAHVETLIARQELVQVYWAQQRWSESETELQRLLQDRRRVSGPKHESTLWLEGALAWTYEQQGRLEDATAQYAEAFEKQREALGDEHDQTFNGCRLLLSIYQRQQRWDDYDRQFAELIRISGVKHGEEHPTTLGMKNELGFALMGRRRWADSEPLFRSALDIGARALGEEHEITNYALVGLAQSLEQLERLAEAEAVFNRCLEVFRRQFGNDHPNAQFAENALKQVLLKQGKREAGIALQTERLRRLQQAAEATDPAPEALNNYAWELLAGEPAELRNAAAALQLAQRAVEMDGSKDPNLLDTLARAWFDTGAVAKAIEVQEKAVSLLPPGESPERTELQATLERYRASTAQSTTGTPSNR